MDYNRIPTGARVLFRLLEYLYSAYEYSEQLGGKLITKLRLFRLIARRKAVIAFGSYSADHSVLIQALPRQHLTVHRYVAASVFCKIIQVVVFQLVACR